MSGRLAAIDMVEKEDVDLVTIATDNSAVLILMTIHTQPNHLVGIQAIYLKLCFHSVEDLMKDKRYDNFNTSLGFWLTSCLVFCSIKG